MAEPDLNVLIIGNGGREHALYKAINASPRAKRVIVTPGNAGIPEDDCWSYKETEHDQLITLAGAKKIDLVVIGPEAPIVAGLGEQMRREGLRVFAPSAHAARLESGKAWVFRMCANIGIPAPAGGVAETYAQAETLIARGFHVVKADGLCAGKGVVVGETTEEALAAAKAMLVDGIHGDAGRCVVLQQKLSGLEASLMFLCDGVNAMVLPVARDNKRLLEGDKGPNTGGMGAYSPVPDVTPQIEKDVYEKIVMPTLRYMRGIGTPFMGLLYVGIMITKEGPKLIEFNVRFGDPETQVVLPRIESDILTYLLACTVPGGLSILPPLTVDPNAFVCTVLVSDGYPGTAATGKEVTFEDPTERARTHFMYAGTRWDNSKILTSGGRVLGAIGFGPDLKQAHERSLAAADRVRFDGAKPYFRRDIVR